MGLNSFLALDLRFLRMTQMCKLGTHSAALGEKLLQSQGKGKGEVERRGGRQGRAAGEGSREGRRGGQQGRIFLRHESESGDSPKRPLLLPSLMNPTPWNNLWLPWQAEEVAAWPPFLVPPLVPQTP